MNAYDPISLSNLFIRQQAADGFYQNCLNKQERDNINARYPVHFYSPDFFIRLGLFMLTIVILLFSFGLLVLIFPGSMNHLAGGMAIFFSLLSYAALEYMVQTKKHFQSGVDDALLWIAASMLFGGLGYLTNAGYLLDCMIIFIISLFGTLRFADRGFSIVLYFSFLGIFFFTAVKFGATAKLFVPFVLMFISFIIYLLTKKTKLSQINGLYSGCLQIISISALVCLYLSGNYFVVRELGNTMFLSNQGGNMAIPFGWLFWLFTLSIPIIYITGGIQKKDIVLIRVGLLLVAMIIFTVRYYYSVASIEVIMVTGGILLLAISYGLTRYLRSPKYGFINQEIGALHAKGKLQVESLLQVQALSAQPAPTGDTNFGGGSFGGGGASGEF